MLKYHLFARDQQQASEMYFRLDIVWNSTEVDKYSPGLFNTDWIWIRIFVVVGASAEHNFLFSQKVIRTNSLGKKSW